jgi:hypothetical protein
VQSTTGTPRTIRLSDCKDGLSSTLIAGEKRMNVAALGNFQGDDNEGYSSGWDHDVMRSTNVVPLPDTDTGDGQTRFGSSHPSGAVFVLGDGAVKAISYNVSQTTFSRLGTRSDRQTLDNDW